MYFNGFIFVLLLLLLYHLYFPFCRMIFISDVVLYFLFIYLKINHIIVIPSYYVKIPLHITNENWIVFMVLSSGKNNKWKIKGKILKRKNETKDCFSQSSEFFWKQIVKSFSSSFVCVVGIAHTCLCFQFGECFRFSVIGFILWQWLTCFQLFFLFSFFLFQLLFCFPFANRLGVSTITKKKEKKIPCGYD